jgi:hypothetical protein
MAATVNQNNTTANVLYSKPRLSIAVVDAASSTEYVLAAAAVDYILLQTSAELDPLGKNPYVGEFIVVPDVKVISFAKALNDAVTTPELVGKSLSKPFVDSFVVTEEILSILITFFRNFSDAIGVSEFVAIDSAKLLAHSVSISESDVFDISKSLSDGVAMNDGADVADGLLMAYAKTVMNIVFASEAKVIAFSKALATSQIIDDSVAFDFEKPLSHSFGVNDLTELVVSLIKADSVSTSDAYSYAFDKSILDAASITELVSKNPGKGLSDASTVEDSGSLLSQSYCDITYFAEDYVGESRTFT